MSFDSFGPVFIEFVIFYRLKIHVLGQIWSDFAENRKKNVRCSVCKLLVYNCNKTAKTHGAGDSTYQLHPSCLKLMV